VSRTQSPAARTAATPWLCRVTAVSCLFGAEAVHIAVMDEHLHEWLLAGLFFLVLAVVEGLLAAALVVAGTPALRWTAVCVSLGTVALWLLTRTAGLPFGPMAGRPEPVGQADMVATLLELVTAVVLLVPLTGTRTAGWRAPARSAAAVVVMLAATAVTLLGVLPEESGPEGPLDLTPSVPPEAQAR
jgi:hypothetical protein